MPGHILEIRQSSGVDFFQHPNFSKSLFKIFMILLQYRNLGAFFAAQPQKTGLSGTPLPLRPRLPAWLLAHPSNPLRTWRLTGY
jgi:hypothetical protein